MTTRTKEGGAVGAGAAQGFPAYGPIDAALGYLLFYVVVDRATPTVLSVAAEVFPDVASSAVGFALASLLWFVLAVTVLDQGRRQAVAAGLVDGDAGTTSIWPSVLPDETTDQLYLALLVVSGLVAASTFETAVETLVSLVRIVAALDVAALDLVALLTTAVFFVAYEAATFSLDRLLVGTVRRLFAG